MLALFAFHRLQYTKLVKIITTLKHEKTMGPDNITPYQLKIALPHIVKSLTYVYNLCIEQNIFPTVLKNAKVVLLPKTNDLSDPSNYRPISRLPHVMCLLRGTFTNTYSSIWKIINSSTSINLDSVLITLVNNVCKIV